MMSEIVKHSNFEASPAATPEIPNARRLILNLLGVAESGRLTVGEALAACALFDISENSVRVTLARLAQAGLVELAERGVYRLGPERRRIQEEIAGWRGTEDRLIAWTGQWIAASTGGLPRSDRKQLRARERALSMLGMRELDYGLYIRPDNLAGGAADVRQRLTALGLIEAVAVFRATDFDSAREKQAHRLWEGAALVEGYRQGEERLEAWRRSAGGLPLDVAARESFLLGDSAIRQIVFDPMLPAPLVDEAARHLFIEAVKRFDDEGRKIWMTFLGKIGG